MYAITFFYLSESLAVPFFQNSCLQNIPRGFSFCLGIETVYREENFLTVGLLSSDQVHFVPNAVNLHSGPRSFHVYEYSQLKSFPGKETHGTP